MVNDFHEIRFPLDVSLGRRGGPSRRTDIVTLASGREHRNARFAHSRRRYDAGLGVRTLDALAAERPHVDFHRDFRAGLDLGCGEPRLLERGDAPLRQQVDGGVYAFQLRHLDRIAEQPIELVAPIPGEEHRGRNRHLSRSEHGAHRDIRLPVEFDFPSQAIGRFFREVVHARDGIEQRDHHQVRSPLLVDEYIKVQVLLF